MLFRSRAADILRQNEEALRRVADNLIRLETIGIEDLEAILEGKELPDPIEAVKEEPAETEAEATPPTSESPAPPPTGRLAEDPGSPA